MLKILGVGLPRTGTQSLSDALEILGLNSIHHAPERLDPWPDAATEATPNFRVYSDVDAVIDAPASYFYRELGDAYPGLRYILTVRDKDTWWRSVRTHTLRIYAETRYARTEYTDRLHAMLFGSGVPNKFLWQRKFCLWNERVAHELAGPPLLVMDITAGDGWRLLCDFLRLPIPDCPFPHANATVLPCEAES